MYLLLARYFEHSNFHVFSDLYAYLHGDITCILKMNQSFQSKIGLPDLNFFDKSPHVWAGAIALEKLSDNSFCLVVGSHHALEFEIVSHTD